MTSDETIRKVVRVILETEEREQGHTCDVDEARLVEYARALDAAGLLAPAQLPERWWRVIGPDGGVWCETSSESEAREKSRPGDTLQQLWETPLVSQWVTEREGSADT